MLFRKEKHALSVSQETQTDRQPAQIAQPSQKQNHPGETPQFCPKPGKCSSLPLRIAAQGGAADHKGQYGWLAWLFPIAGLLSLIWFLIRVVPKPSRATYPCQRVAAPLATGFVVWLTGMIGSILAYRKARRFLHQSRYVVAGICAAVAVLTLWWSFSITSSDPAAAAPFTPSEPANSPMGVAKGIFPGRVVWVRDPDATSWDGSTGSWWHDDNTDQDIVNYMVSKSIQSLTGSSNDKDAWDALFRHFNQTRGLGDVGYGQGERVAIKINMNQDSGGSWSKAKGVPSPHLIHSFLDQLINVAGVPGSAVTIYDASRYIGDPIYDKVRSNPDPNFQSVRFVANATRDGRIRATRDTANPVLTRAGTAYLPQCVTQAKYLINMALLRPHTLYGITLCAKNHFGSTYFNSWTPEPLHDYGDRGRPMGSYNCLVNLNGHKHLGGKTLLYMIDGLYPSVHQNGDVIRYQSFGGDWFSSILVSQDPVAIDSVGLDFMRNEPRCTNVTGNPDNYLHEAALADNPPSGTFYDPEGDRERMNSLGVHEHWNNATDRQYSRNLGTGNGIELVVPPLTSPDGPIENPAKGTRYNHIRDAIRDAEVGDEVIAAPGTYRQSISFGGKNVTVRSQDPADLTVVAGTVFSGSQQAASFSGGEDASCVLAGLTLTGGNQGIYCPAASPTIANCTISGSRGAGIKLWSSSNPTISNCVIAGNKGPGIEMWAEKFGRFIKYNYATISNCTIARNLEHGIFGGLPTVADSIVYYNGPGPDTAQIDCYLATVSYSNVQGSWVGDGNIDADPLFVDVGRWEDNGTPEDPNDDLWIAGDLHLRFNSPCINAGDPSLTAEPGETDIDGEPRIMAGRVDMGSDEVGPKQADFTRNGIIDTEDVTAFVQAWLTTPGQTKWAALCDLAEDEYVDLSDWAKFAGDWRWQADWYSQ